MMASTIDYQMTPEDENWMRKLPGYKTEIALFRRLGKRQAGVATDRAGEPEGSVEDHSPAKTLKPVRVKVKGGAGSGNFRHAGRPGLVGGSTLSKLSATTGRLATQLAQERVEHMYMVNEDGSVHKSVSGEEANIGMETLLTKVTDADTYARHIIHNHPNGLIGLSPADVRSLGGKYARSITAVGRRADNGQVSSATLSNPAFDVNGKFVGNKKFIGKEHKMAAEYEKLMKVKALELQAQNPSMDKNTRTMKAANDVLEQLAPKYGLAYEHNEHIV